MYYDDPYHPNLPNDYDDDEDNQLGGDLESRPESYHYQNVRHDADTISTSSISTVRRKKRKLFEDQKSIDKGYCKIRIMVGHNKVPVEYYHTNDTPGAGIRNAVTGIYETGYKVGKWHEDLYFKVVFTVNKSRHQLFYDSPEQHEKQFFTVVDRQIKDEWEAKAIRARQFLRSENEPEREFTTVN
jgi:hypothetical protein